MEHLLLTFFRPYASLLVGAAYNIQQTLDALGILPSSFVAHDATGRPLYAYWSLSEAAALPFAIVTAHFFVLTAGALIAGFSLGRTKGALIVAAIWLLPGSLALAGLWPDSPIFTPERFATDSVGTLGSPWGMTALVVLALLSGWIGAVIATDVFSLQDRFRHLYDHAWYALAVLAGVFFVADSETRQAQRDLEDNVVEIHGASDYLLTQVRRLSEHCIANRLTEAHSCRWSDRVQQKLVEYVTYNAALYEAIGPERSGDLYMPFEQPVEKSIEAIRSELASFNEALCPTSPGRITPPSHVCQQTPAAFCQRVDPPVRAMDHMLRTVAIANECVVPTLVHLRERVLVDSSRVAAEMQAKHARWLFYVFFAALAGGKVANATARLSKVRTNARGLGDQKNIRSLADQIINLTRQGISVSLNHSRAAYKFSRRAIGAALRLSMKMGKRMSRSVTATMRRTSST